MTQDITAIIDGIKRSVEAVGRSGRDDVYLDNVSFRVDATRIDVPYDSSVTEAREAANWLVAHFDQEDYDPELGEIFLNNDEGDLDEILCLQLLPVRRTGDGAFIDMTATISCSDVTNELPQTVLVCETVLHRLAEAAGMRAGRITFNVAHAYVQWDDVEQLVEWDDIEIPR